VLRPHQRCSLSPKLHYSSEQTFAAALGETAATVGGTSQHLRNDVTSAAPDGLC
jgi:hypothetical protein